MIYTFPYQILAEEHALGKIDAFLSSLSLGTKGLIVADEAVASYAQQLVSAVSSCTLSVVFRPSLERSALEAFSKTLHAVDFVIALGGGRTLDGVKHACYLARKRWIAFPTVLSNDGAISSRAVITDTGVKTSIESLSPFAIIADFSLIRQAPKKLNMAGVGDVLSNLSALWDWQLADAKGIEPYNPFVGQVSQLAVDVITTKAADIAALTPTGVKMLFWSILCSSLAMNLYGSSRPASGGEHNFSHALEQRGVDALHGEQCALGTLIMAHLHGKDVSFVHKQLAFFGLPVTAKQIGISPEHVIDALYHARSIRDRYTILTQKNLTREQCNDVLKELEII